jgi:hypothetical protein
MNVCPDEVIRSLFYNKNNDSLITVSVYATENFSSLKCRSTRIECVHSVVVHSNFSFQCVKCMLLTYWFLSVPRYIRRAKPDAGFPLFQSESLKWPGFVEFDDVNAKVLTYSAQDRYFPSLFLFLFHFYCVFFHRLFYLTLTRFYPMTTVYTRSLILKTTLCYTRFQIGTFKRSKSGTFLVLDWFSALLFRYLQKLHFDKLILSSHDHNHYHILHHTKHITSKKKYFKEVKVLAK